MTSCMAQTLAPILLVEDDPSVRRSLVAFLEDHGYQTRSAATLRDARLALRDGYPRLCLLDLNLPDGNGLDLLRDLIRLRAPSRVAVMTAFPLHHLLPPDARPTLVGWMTKPVAPGQLLELVESSLKADS